MILVPCSNCHTVFQSGLIGGPGKVTATIRGCRETCPHCGELAQIPDAVYEVDGKARQVNGFALRAGAFDEIFATLRAMTEAATYTHPAELEDFATAPWWPYVERLLPKDAKEAVMYLWWLLACWYAMNGISPPEWPFK